MYMYMYMYFIALMILLMMQPQAVRPLGVAGLGMLLVAG